MSRAIETYTVEGVYGSDETPANILVAVDKNGLRWYCVEGSLNVNATLEPVTEGVNVELLEDYDGFSTLEPIDTEEELKEALES